MKDTTDRRIIYYLFGFCCLIYFISSPGPYFFSDVAVMRNEVVRSIVEKADLSVPDGMGIKGVDGKNYSWFGIGSVVLSLPFYFLGKVVGAAAPENFFCLLNPLIEAATVALVYLFCTYLGYSKRVSLMTSVFYGFGTLAWPYAKETGDHVIETFCILFSVFCMYRRTVDHKSLFLILCGVSLGMAFLTRTTSILMMLPLFIMLALSESVKDQFADKRRKFIRSTLIIFFVLVPFICISCWYNYYRFGSIFESGYSLMAARIGMKFFSGTSFFAGFTGLSISPGKGFFYYSPIALLFFFSIKNFLKRYRSLSICFVVAILTYFIFFSTYIYWHGDWAWGPRYIFVLTPFFIIPVAELLGSVVWSKRSFLRSGVYLLFFASVGVQLAAISVHPYKYFVFLGIEKKVEFKVAQGKDVQPIWSPPAETYFDWHLSPIVAQFKFISEIAEGIKQYKYIEALSNISYEKYLESMPFMHLFDFWWVYESFLGGNSSAPLLALILLLPILYLSLQLRKYFVES